MGKVNFMHARNKITIIILSLVVTGAIFGSLITVRDFDIIINDFNNFDGFADPDGIIFPDWEGMLNLYVSSDTDVETANSTLLKYLPSDETVSDIWVTVNQIQIKGRNSQKYTDVIDDPIKLNLMNLNDSMQMLNQVRIKAGNYTNMNLSLEGNVTITINGKNETFSIQGGSSFIIPFFRYRYQNTNQADLKVEKGKDTQVLVEFRFRINTANKICIAIMNAYLTF